MSRSRLWVWIGVYVQASEVPSATLEGLSLSHRELLLGRDASDLEQLAARCRVEGWTAAALRGVLSGMGLECVEEILGGKSVSWFVAQVWKQAMVDKLLLAWETDHGESPTCLYEIFCWRSSSGERSRLDDFLGPVDAEGVRDYHTLVDLFSEGLSGFCAHWSELSCEDRDSFQKMVSNWGCMKDLFPDDAEVSKGEPPPFALPQEFVEPDLPDVWIPYGLENTNLRGAAWLDPGFQLNRDILPVLAPVYTVPELLIERVPWWR